MNPLTPATERVVWRSQDLRFHPVTEWLAWLVVATLSGIAPIPAQESDDE